MTFVGRRRRELVAAAEHERLAQQRLLKDLLTYEVLANRATARDGLIWQTPALALTAQAFLLTIALAGDTARLSRCVASGLAVLVSVMSWQLMTKHAHLTFYDRDELEHLERDVLDMRVIHGKPDPDAASTATTRPTPTATWSRTVRWKSHKLWKRGLLLFAATALAIFVIALTAPQWLETAPA